MEFLRIGDWTGEGLGKCWRLTRGGSDGVDVRASARQEFHIWNSCPFRE
jgi:hypothetical protein